MKKLFSVLLFLGVVLFSNAEEQPQLVIQAKDGTKVSYLLRTYPVIKFTDNEILVSSDEVQLSYSVAQTDKFYYETVDVPESGIKDIQTEELIYQFRGNAILFPNLKDDSTISIYTIGGSLLFSKDNIRGGEYLLSLNNIPIGIYLINVNQLTCKILKQ